MSVTINVDKKDMKSISVTAGSCIVKVNVLSGCLKIDESLPLKPIHLVLYLYTKS
jgi:hypothetical protein